MNSKKLRLILLLTVITLFSVGCAGRHVIPANPSNPIRSVAVLPILNNSDDVEAPEIIRAEFHKRIGNYHYAVKSLEETQQILDGQMGITLGKQLELTSPEKLGETLGVDGVFYGYLLNYDEITTVVFNTKKLRMGWKLVDTKTGRQAWGKGIAVKSNESLPGVGAAVATTTQVKDALLEDKVDPLPTSSDPMKEMPGLGKWILMESKSTSPTPFGIGLSLVSKLADKVTGSSFEEEMNFAFNRLFPNMLIGPGAQAGTATETQ